MSGNEAAECATATAPNPVFGNNGPMQQARLTSAFSRFTAALLLVAAAGAEAGQAPPTEQAAEAAIPTPSAPTLKVGSLTLTRCGVAYCGRILRALDPAGQVPGNIGIHFQYLPQRDAALPSAGALVATEGGPGYPTTGTRSSYVAMLRPLLADRSLLLVNNRGTGNSAVIDCPPLQKDPLYRDLYIAACGAQLGARSDLYGTGPAADDLAAVIEALQLVPVDLYGDSYGSFFAQAFAARHPSLVRSVVLDGAYAVAGLDPWYPEVMAQTRTAFNQACSRSPSCQNLPDASMQRISALLGSLRAKPVAGTANDGDGNPQSVTADARNLAYLMTSNASGPVVYRDLDAAARAWFEGDQAPLLRLVAENKTSAFSANGAPQPNAFSAGLFAAVSCSDYPQVYDMTQPVPVRVQAARAAIAAKKLDDPNVYAPFTIDEYLAVPQDYSVVNLCLTWPAPSAAHPPGQPVAPGTRFPGTPVLVLSGDLDLLTPPAQGAQAAALFPNARQVIVENSFHVTALGDEYDCASKIVRTFMQTLAPGDTACAAQIPEVHLVPRFATRVAQLPAAEAVSGNEGTRADLQTVEAALLTAGDALARWWITSGSNGAGLRGGRFSYQFQHGATLFNLDRLKWTADLEVSGSMALNWKTGEISATLNLPGGTLRAQWSDQVPLATATISGTLAGRHIAATMYAP